MSARTAPLVTPARAPLAQLLHDLRTIGDLRRHADAVDARLDGFTTPVDRLVPYLPLPRSGYARTLVWRDDAFEMLLLTWAPNSRAPIHDHAEQDCWLVSLAGTFDVDDYALVGADKRRAWLTPLRSRRLGEGGLDRRDLRDSLHAVTAVTPVALSLHVYARPIDRCRVYDLARGTWAWRRLGYDRIAPQLGEE
jgi:cysteine dioxygenase